MSLLSWIDPSGGASLQDIVDVFHLFCNTCNADDYDADMSVKDFEAGSIFAHCQAKLVARGPPFMNQLNGGLIGLLVHLLGTILHVQDVPVLMVGSGAGVAPFRGFWEELICQCGQSVYDFETVSLILKCCHKARFRHFTRHYLLMHCSKFSRTSL
eukprot:995056-Amphidinium_carterae.2